MSKIICDVCGTSYADSVNQCPICGCVRPVDAHPVTSIEEEDMQSAPSGTYNYVKGGRFSKTNVKKRNTTRKPEPADPEELDLQQERETEKADRGLFIAFIVLLLSVAAVVCYILVKFLSPELFNPNSVKKPGTGDLNNDPAISTEQDDGVACEDITIGQDNILLDMFGATVQLEVTLVPGDTTEQLSFESSNTDVAKVSDDGVITAVGSGEATITVKCGDVEKTCKVTCDIETVEPTLPSVPSVDLPSVAPGFELNRSDFTLFKKGETWTLYSGSIPSDEITWTSSNPKVATVTKGKVTAVSAGKATITAEYKGSKLTCTVYCKDSVGEYVDPDQDTSAGNDQNEQNKYKLNTAGRGNDITIYVGDSYTLKLLDENDQVVDASFTTSNDGICSVSAGTVTGESAGRVNITVKYNGETHVCIVRVKER